MINFYLSVLETGEDKNLFEDLYLKYRQSMYAVAYSILNNVEDSEDAVHNAFLTIADNFEKIKAIPCHEIKTYFIIIVRNVSINIYNKNKKNSERFTELAGNKISVDINFFENIDYEKLVQTISNLPMIYKDVLYLHYINGFTTKEIAKMLDISIDTVRKRIERAKKLLKAELEKGEIHV